MIGLIVIQRNTISFRLVCWIWKAFWVFNKLPFNTIRNILNDCFFAFLVILTYVHFLEVSHLIFYYYEIHVI